MHRLAEPRPLLPTWRGHSCLPAPTLFSARASLARLTHAPHALARVSITDSTIRQPSMALALALRCPPAGQILQRPPGFLVVRLEAQGLGILRHGFANSS